MKAKKIIISFFLATAIVASFVSSAYAFPGYYWWYPNNMHVRIYHPASEMYLGIDPNGNEQNGARLQLQNYQEGNQLQIFYLKYIASDSAGHRYYQIRVHGENGKIIEVRNSSKDDWGEVAQWDEHTNYCAIWSFFTENPHSGGESPVCCIKNYNSQKLLNVAGGNHYNGNNMIQYHEDGTSSEEFQIINVEDEITGAIWTADWNNRGIWWSGAKDTEQNRQRYDTPITKASNGYILYPQGYDENKWYLASVFYLDSNMQKQIVMMHDEDLFKTTDQKLREYFLGEAIEYGADKGIEYVIDKYLGKTKLGGIPSGTIMGFIDIIMNGHSDIQWKRLAEYFKDNPNVRIETYYKFQGDPGWYTTAYVIVGDKNSVYWDGRKSSIDTTYYDSDGTVVNGSMEYFYK